MTTSRHLAVRVLVWATSSLRPPARIQSGDIRHYGPGEACSIQLRGASSLTCCFRGCRTRRSRRPDPDRLQQIIGNLLSNAIKLTAASGVVTLRYRANGGVVSIAVEDTGIGIAADRLE